MQLKTRLTAGGRGMNHNPSGLKLKTHIRAGRGNKPNHNQTSGFCGNCGNPVKPARFCGNCGASLAAPKPPSTFWTRLANAIAMQAAIQAQQNRPGSGRLWRNSDGSASYVNDASGNSTITDSDGNIYFTR